LTIDNTLANGELTEMLRKSAQEMTDEAQKKYYKQAKTKKLIKDVRFNG
jgi:hypothetical protein